MKLSTYLLIISWGLLPQVLFFCSGNILIFHMSRYGETSPIPLIVSIISAGLLCIVLFLAWKEAQKEDKPYIPVLKFILASIFFLWHLSMGFHFYYDLPNALGNSHYFPEFQHILPILESVHIFKVLIFILYIIFNLLFFGRIFLKGKFKERQGMLFSFTGLLLVVGVFTLIFGLINVAQLFNYYRYAYIFLTVTFSFIIVIGPVLMMAMVLALFGGLLSILKKRLGKSGVKVPGRVRIKGTILTLAAIVLYMFFFGALWPFKDPAVNVHLGVLKKCYEKHPKDWWLGIASDFVDFEFRLYGRSATCQMINKLDDNSPFIRAWAAYYLGFFGDQRAVEPLIKALNDRDRLVMSQAALALAELKQPRAIDILLEKLDHEDKEFRESVVGVLVIFKDVRVVDKLIEQLKTEKDRDVILAINRSLSMIAKLEEPYLDEDEKSAQWWQQWWKQNREEFIKKWPTN